MARRCATSVIPAQAGIQGALVPVILANAGIHERPTLRVHWIPACAGMTEGDAGMTETAARG